MPLTPIRVRGKRKRKTPANEPLEQKSKDDNGSPPKQRQKRAVKKSLLERQLPLEVMESIHLYSENLNFARSSPLLGLLLSGHQTLVETIIAAFGPTWNVTFGFCGGLCTIREEVLSRRIVRKDHEQDLPTLPREESDTIPVSLIPGNPKFQSAVLACRWASIDMILEAQQKWARLFAGNRTYSHVCPAKLDRIEMHPPGITQGLPPGDGPPREFETAHGEVGGPGHFDAYACFDFDFNRVTDFPLAKPFDSMRHQVRFADVHPNVLIPEKLVTGPWDEEMVRRLVWLRRGGAILQESQTWELKLIGFRNAFAADTPSSFLPLILFWLIIREDFFWPVEFQEDECCIAVTEGPSWPAEVLYSIYEDVWDKTGYQSQLSAHTRSLCKLLRDHIEYALEAKEKQVTSRRGWR